MDEILSGEPVPNSRRGRENERCGHVKVRDDLIDGVPTTSVGRTRGSGKRKQGKYQEPSPKLFCIAASVISGDSAASPLSRSSKKQGRLSRISGLSRTLIP
jgi:hypothetical protein